VAAAVPSSRDLIQRGEAGNPADETPVAKVWFFPPVCCEILFSSGECAITALTLGCCSVNWSGMWTPASWVTSSPTPCSGGRSWVERAAPSAGASPAVSPRTCAMGGMGNPGSPCPTGSCRVGVAGAPLWGPTLVGIAGAPLWGLTPVGVAGAPLRGPTSAPGCVSGFSGQGRAPRWVLQLRWPPGPELGRRSGERSVPEPPSSAPRASISRGVFAVGDFFPALSWCAWHKPARRNPQPERSRGKRCGENPSRDLQRGRGSDGKAPALGRCEGLSSLGSASSAQCTAWPSALKSGWWPALSGVLLGTQCFAVGAATSLQTGGWGAEGEPGVPQRGFSHLKQKERGFSEEELKHQINQYGFVIGKGVDVDGWELEGGTGGTWDLNPCHVLPSNIPCFVLRCHIKRRLWRAAAGLRLRHCVNLLFAVVSGAVAMPVPCREVSRRQTQLCRASRVKTAFPGRGTR